MSLENNRKIANFCSKAEWYTDELREIDRHDPPEFDEDWEWLMYAIRRIKDRDRFEVNFKTPNAELLEPMYNNVIESLEWCLIEKIYPRVVDYVTVWNALGLK